MEEVVGRKTLVSQCKYKIDKVESDSGWCGWFSTPAGPCWDITAIWATLYTATTALSLSLWLFLPVSWAVKHWKFPGQNPLNRCGKAEEGGQLKGRFQEGNRKNLVFAKGERIKIWCYSTVREFFSSTHNSIPNFDALKKSKEWKYSIRSLLL